MEDACYLKTKTDRFRPHWAVLNGHEIFFYRKPYCLKGRVMHSLANTFIKNIENERCPDTDKELYPVKIILPPSKSRILYFDS